MRLIKYDHQVGDQSRVGLRWLGGSGRPSGAEIKAGGAIPCHLNFVTHSDCYFGQGVYSDWICDEVGRVISSSLRVRTFYFRNSAWSFLHGGKFLWSILPLVAKYQSVGLIDLLFTIDQSLSLSFLNLPLLLSTLS